MPAAQIIRPENPIPGQYIFLLDGAQVPAAAVRSVADELVSSRGVVLSVMDGSVLAFMAGELDDDSALAILADPRVTGVGQDGYVDIAAATRASAAEQPNATWGLDRIDQRQLPLDSIYRQKTTGAGVNVYVIDTGINDSHADFGGRVQEGMTAILDNGGTADCQGHGTHVAGTIGGTSWGVAKDATVYAVRALDCTGRGSLSGIIAAIDWVTHHHVKPAVVNMSLGSRSNSMVDTAVRSSIEAGLIYVVAAGNSNEDACTYSPARVGEALTVAASTSTDQRASFSNHGGCVDLFAPGAQITSSRHDDNAGSKELSGTSMAAPHVAGVVALYLEANPTATQADVAAALLEAATTSVVQDLQGSPDRLLYSYFITPPAPPCGDAAPGAPPCTLPATCADIAARNPAAGDGEHTLYIDGNAAKPWTAYCHDMAGEPHEYLTLSSTGPDRNFAQYTAGGASAGTSVRTSYTRVRVNPADMSVVIVDKTFASSTGSLTHGSTPVTSMSYGVAMSCDSSPSGLANIDLTGTPFVVATGFCQGGFQGQGAATPSRSGQIVDITGGGFCGWSAPSNPSCPGDPYNDNPSSTSIQLAYLPSPATCADVAALDPAAADGDYTLYVDRDETKPWTAYCHDMAGEPREYLALSSTGADRNFSQYTAGGASQGTSVRTSYTRVRIDPTDMTVSIVDKTFATSTGSLVHGGQPVTSMPYAVAMSCDSSASGLANIDLTGTPFAVTGGFCQAGWQPKGAATPSSSGQIVDVTGGGYCGWSAPSDPCPFNPFNSNPRSTSLALTYITQ